MKKKSPLLEKTFNLSVRIVRLCQKINIEQKQYELSKQLLRSGTNPGAMLREAQKAESKKDFIHKLKIAQKETEETQYWLELFKETAIIEIADYRNVSGLTLEIQKMLSSAILTTKRNLQSNS